MAHYELTSTLQMAYSYTKQHFGNVGFIKVLTSKELSIPFLFNSIHIFFEHSMIKSCYFITITQKEQQFK